MAKKKSTNINKLERLLERPWCFYCERDFDDLKVLISHQRAQHFKCDKCNKRLNTAGGLVIHVQQVHKETLTAVFNALPGRERTDIEIFGLEGIPEEVIQAREAKLRENFAAAGIATDKNDYTNSTVSASTPPAKRQKIVSVDREAIQAKLAAHKAAKKAAIDQTALANEKNTPSLIPSMPVSHSIPFTPQTISGKTTITPPGTIPNQSNFYPPPPPPPPPPSRSE
ncbi:hypothetical protein V1512DRAFT_280925 [Lipomyces arxii]|uniref:uncharacterized protein n=1 Tax=Lipomyces arxii TaxID=56418 RepID=UPI0034CD3B70